MANTVTNVSAGKPAVGGAIYVAAIGTTLPSDATTSLGGSFTCLGYVSDDGLKNTTTPTTEEIKAWGGDTVLVTQTEKSDTFSFKLIEALNVEVLKVVYNSDNVSGSALASGITVSVDADEAEARIWVFDTILTGGVLKRIVVPNAKITEVGEITYKDNEAIGYDITIKAMPGDSNFGYATHKEYIKKPSASSS